MTGIKRADRPGLWARVFYTDESGQKRIIQRKVKTWTEGKLLPIPIARWIPECGAAKFCSFDGRTWTSDA